MSVVDIEGHVRLFRSARVNERPFEYEFDEVDATDEVLVSDDDEPCVATRLTGNTIA